MNKKFIILSFFFIFFFNSFLLLKSETIILLISFYILFSFVFSNKNDLFTNSSSEEEVNYLDELDWYILMTLFIKIKMWYKYFIRFTFIKLSIFYKFISFFKNYFLYWLSDLILLLKDRNKYINLIKIKKRLLMIYKLQKSHKYKNNKLTYINYLK